MCNLMLVKYLIEQYGGVDGELVVVFWYLNQCYMIFDKVIGFLIDIGMEEFVYLEMIVIMVYKLMKDVILEQFCEVGFGDYYVNYDGVFFYYNVVGVLFIVSYIQVKGDLIVDLYEDIVVEEKVWVMY